MQQINDKKLNRILAQYVTSSSYAAAGLFPVPVLQKPKKKKNQTPRKKSLISRKMRTATLFLLIRLLVLLMQYWDVI